MKVDVGMLDCQVAILENAIARYFATGEIPGPLGARHATIAPFQSFATEDSHIIIAAGNDQLFQKLCVALDVPALAGDPRFASNQARARNVEALALLLESRLKTAPTSEWLKRLDAAGIPNGPINNVEQVVTAPQVGARNMVVHTADPIAGDVKMAGNPIKLSAFADPEERMPAPDLDQHRAAILRELGL
jgi:CoA:oxalate CoA-transferase